MTLTATRVDQGEQRARYHVHTSDGDHVARVLARYAGGFLVIPTRHGPCVEGHVASLEDAVGLVAGALERDREVREVFTYRCEACDETYESGVELDPDAVAVCFPCSIPRW